MILIFLATTPSFLSSGQENEGNGGKEKEAQEMKHGRVIIYCFVGDGFASLHFQIVHFTMAIRRSLNGFSAARHYTPIRQMMSSASRSGVWVRLPTFRVPYE